MRSEQLDLGRYRTDKVVNRYMQWYDALLSDRYESVEAVLELGVHFGGSLELWRDYFPAARVAGIDADLSRLSCSDRTRIEALEGSQTDTSFLGRVARQIAPDGFALIIDDASHIATDAETSFWFLFDHHLKPGGIYVIEDWGSGYVGDWPDGRAFEQMSWLSKIRSRVARRLGFVQPVRSHEYGMVGFIKKLIDEQGMENLSRETPPGRMSKFEDMWITPGLVAIRKV